MKRISDVSRWLFLTCFFSLLQLVYDVLPVLVGKPFPIEKILADCSLLFFASGLLATPLVDSIIEPFWENKGNKANRASYRFWYSAFPLVCIIFITMIYAVVHGSDEKTLKANDTLKNLEYYVCIASLFITAKYRYDQLSK